MRTLYKKELNYYLNNPIGYIIVILFAVFANFLFLKDIFIIGSASMRPFFSLLPWLYLVFIPALSMRIISEEKRSNTMELLLTLPVSETQIVLAKFLALETLLVIALLLTLGLMVSISFLTKIYLPEVLIGYLGALLLGKIFISISMLFSVFTKNQVVAFLISVLSLFIILVLGTDFMAGVLPKFIIDILGYFTPMYHFQNFIKGIIDLRSIVYFLSVLILSLLVTIVSLEKRD